MELDIPVKQPSETLLQLSSLVHLTLIYQTIKLS
jgi:hypothetical protein